MHQCHSVYLKNCLINYSASKVLQLFELIQRSRLTLKGKAIYHKAAYIGVPFPDLQLCIARCLLETAMTFSAIQTTAL